MTTNTNLIAPITLTCICGTDHDFAPGEGTGTCAGCGIGLVLSEEVSVDEAAMESDTPMGLDDDNACDADYDEEPYDIDDDRGYNPYTGASEDDGYDTGYDDYPGVGYDD